MKIFSLRYLKMRRCETKSAVIASLAFFARSGNLGKQQSLPQHVFSRGCASNPGKHGSSREIKSISLTMTKFFRHYAKTSSYYFQYIFLLLFCFTTTYAQDPNNLYLEELLANSQVSDVYYIKVEHLKEIIECEEFEGKLKVSHLPSFITPRVAETTETGGAVGSAVSTAAGKGSSAIQAARTKSVFKLVNCQDNEEFSGEELDWIDNPTTLALGDGKIRYALGSVVGNSMVISGFAAAMSILSRCKDAEKVRYPSVIALPVLFLSTATTTQALNLIRFGEMSHIFLGAGYIVAHVTGTGLIAKFLLPSNFKGTFDKDEAKWLDPLDISGYTGKYGIFFKEYRQGRTGFIVIELAMNLASGMLASFVEDQSSCATLSGVSAAIYGVYAGATVILCPYLGTDDKIYFTFLSLAQATPLAIIASGTESENAKAVATATPLFLNWVLLARSAFEAVMFARSLYKFYHRVKPVVAAVSGTGTPLLGGVPVPVDGSDSSSSSDSDTEMGVVNNPLAVGGT